jgi:hypothetical protein
MTHYSHGTQFMILLLPAQVQAPPHLIANTEITEINIPIEAVACPYTSLK